MKPLAIFLLVLVSGFGLWGCDKIKPPYSRPLFEGTIDTIAYPPPVFSPDFSTQRVVLIEDYTGHTCGYCPNAADVLNAITAAMPDKVVGLAVHAGDNFAAPSPPDYPNDFRTEAGTAWDNFFGISAAGQPNGMVNRKVFNGSRISPYATWNTRAQGILNAQPTADIQLAIKNYYLPAENKLISYVYAAVLNPQPHPVKLGVYIMEDSVIAPQKRYVIDTVNGGLITLHIKDYVHRHMLRGHSGSIWGETIFPAGAPAGTTVRKDHLIAIKPEWKVKHCKIVCIAYDAVTYEVIQAFQKKFIE
ncbi:MAG: Omp28-related outer membrane protein [Flavobacteriales bacterium]|nr:Omp28-related outer membrane protein [Flavobacteriales bacterium]MDW8410398.1 Omp28-related outer membrane protein [Flavobacteriales bacterium]